MSEMTKERKNELWTMLKSSWSTIKSSDSDMEKHSAKIRINEIQKELGLDLTDWNAPRKLKTIDESTTNETILLHSRQIAQLTNELNTIKEHLGL